MAVALNTNNWLNASDPMSFRYVEKYSIFFDIYLFVDANSVPN